MSFQYTGWWCGFLFWWQSSHFYHNPLVLRQQISVHAMGVPIPPIAQMVCPFSEYVQDLEWTTLLGSSFQMSRARAFHQNHVSAFVRSSIQHLHLCKAFVSWHQFLRLTAICSNFGPFLRLAAYLPLFSCFSDQLPNYDLMVESHRAAKHDLCWAFGSSSGCTHSVVANSLLNRLVKW